MVLMLPINVDEMSPDLRKQTSWTQAAIQIGPVSSCLADDSSNHQFLLVVVSALPDLLPKCRRQRRKKRLDAGLVFPMANDVGGNPTSRKKAESVQNDGLPSSGLSR